jgi:hypothetical protein
MAKYVMSALPKMQLPDLSGTAHYRSRVDQPNVIPMPKRRDSALPQRDSLASVLQHRSPANAGSRQEVGGEIRVRIEAPQGMNTSAKVSKPAGSKVGLTANVGRVSW